MKSFILGAALLAVLVGCKSSEVKPVDEMTYGNKLSSILNAQSDDAKSRYAARNPAKTLAFFRVKPGDTVVEVLPGGGWYSKILLPYLGESGHLIGVDYPMSIWPNFPFANDDFIAGRKDWPSQWVADARGWAGESGPELDAYAFDSIPPSLDGQVDSVLFIRALHNLARYESQGDFLNKALTRSYRMLKSGGYVGVVQHAVGEFYADDWADGSHGYLKASFVKQRMKDAGFVFVAEADFNANPKDVPADEDSVWRLPPSLSTSKEDPQLREEMLAIGESNRMTLLFKKP